MAQFSVDTWITLRRGLLDWLKDLAETGYALGSELVEGPYLRDDADGSVTAERILEALEREGLIRRGELRPSHSQRAFTAFTLGGARHGSKVENPPATWYAWHPYKEWTHPALRPQQTLEAP